MKYLVDTNILIYLMNSKSKKLQEKFTRRKREQFCVSSITVAEMVYGAKNSQYVEKNLNAVIYTLSEFEILDFSNLDAFEYGDIRSDLKKKGRLIGPNDLLIAAQARRQNLVLITNNTKEFNRVAKLKVEDWTKEIS
jgi:tRNA(fMet)-specific endonuclease VapC